MFHYGKTEAAMSGLISFHFRPAIKSRLSYLQELSQPSVMHTVKTLSNGKFQIIWHENSLTNFKTLSNMRNKGGPARRYFTASLHFLDDSPAARLQGITRLFMRR
jgi:hypothetical protein